MTLQAKKKFFSDICFTLAHLYIETKKNYFYQNFISSGVQRNHGRTKKWQFVAKNDAAGQKIFFSDICFTLAHLYIEKKKKMFLSKFHIFSRLEKSLRDKKRQFSTRNDAAFQKNDFFRIFFSVAHLYIETKLFCV